VNKGLASVFRSGLIFAGFKTWFGHMVFNRAFCRERPGRWERFRIRDTVFGTRTCHFSRKILATFEESLDLACRGL